MAAQTDSAKTKQTDPFAGHRAAGGRFKPGNPGGPGRPRAIVDIRRELEKAELTGELDAQQVVLKTLHALAVRVEKTGCPAAAKLLLERLAGPAVDPAPTVEVNVGTGARPPRLPPLEPDGTGAPTLADHIERLQQIARERGLKGLPLGFNGTRSRPEDEPRIVVVDVNTEDTETNDGEATP